MSMCRVAFLLAGLNMISCSTSFVNDRWQIHSSRDCNSTAALANLLLAPGSTSRWPAHGVTRDRHHMRKPPSASRSPSPFAQFSSSMPRVAVFGGRGFIGSRTCRTLVEAGCEVISVSLTDAPPEWAKDEPWVKQVQWLSVASAATSLGALDAAVSCVGNVRPSPDYLNQFGLDFKSVFPLLERQNGDVNVQIAEAAKKAGARRFTYVSVSSDVDYAFGGALRGYIKGKRKAAEAVNRLFGDGGVMVGPSLVYGGGRFSSAGKAYEAFTSSPPTTFLVDVLRKLNDRSLSPSDRVNIIALSPPVDVELVARAIVAGTLGSTPSTFMDGSAEITQVAQNDGESESLKVAAAQLAQGRSPISVLSNVFGQPISLPEEGAGSVEGAPFEGAFVGQYPYLFPIPWILGLFALFASFPRVQT